MALAVWEAASRLALDRLRAVMGDGMGTTSHGYRGYLLIGPQRRARLRPCLVETDWRRPVLRVPAWLPVARGRLRVAPPPGLRLGPLLNSPSGIRLSAIPRCRRTPRDACACAFGSSPALRRVSSPRPPLGPPPLPWDAPLAPARKSLPSTPRVGYNPQQHQASSSTSLIRRALPGPQPTACPLLGPAG
jgi:hypothetical protein